MCCRVETTMPTFSNPAEEALRRWPTADLSPGPRRCSLPEQRPSVRPAPRPVESPRVRLRAAATMSLHPRPTPPLVGSLLMRCAGEYLLPSLSLSLRRRSPWWDLAGLQCVDGIPHDRGPCTAVLGHRSISMATPGSIVVGPGPEVHQEVRGPPGWSSTRSSVGLRAFPPGWRWG